MQQLLAVAAHEQPTLGCEEDDDGNGLGGEDALDSDEEAAAAADKMVAKFGNDLSQVQKGNLTIRYCPTDDMIADFMSKPLQDEKFRQFRKDILNLE